MATEFVESRSAFGRTLADHQGIQSRLGDCMLDIYTTKWATLHAGSLLDRGGDARTETAMVKVYGANAICRVVDRILQVFGGYGVMKDLPIERIYREARIQRLIDGTDEIQKVSMIKGLRKGWRP